MRKFSNIFQDDGIMNELLEIDKPEAMIQKMKELLEEYLII